MKSRIQKWGNSLAIRIPIQLVKRFHLHHGNHVNLEIEDGRIVIQTPQYNLNAMVKAITPENQHHQLLDES